MNRTTAKVCRKKYKNKKQKSLKFIRDLLLFWNVVVNGRPFSFKNNLWIVVTCQTNR